MKKINRTNKTFVIVTNDGPGHENCFLTWTTDLGGYYTTVDYFDEIGEYDFHDTIEAAEVRAKDADSGTFNGWSSPMKIMEVLNFNEAYNNGVEPELVEVKIITF
jgi:hypothetical protein